MPTNGENRRINGNSRRRMNNRLALALLASCAVHAAAMLVPGGTLFDAGIPSRPDMPLAVRLLATEHQASSMPRQEPPPDTPREAAVRPVEPSALDDRERWHIGGAPAPGGIELLDVEYHPASALDVRPVIQAPLVFAYPSARDPPEAGLVTLEIRINELGEVDRVDVAHATLAKPFREAAVAAFQNVRYRPGRLNGKAVKALIKVEVAFSPEPPAH